MDLLAYAIIKVLDILPWLIVARAIMTWIPASRENNTLNQIARILFQITEPILAPVRKLIQKSSLGSGGMMVDFSPMVAILLIWVAKIVVASLFLSQ